MHSHPHNPHSHVLQLDIQGTPQAWISLEQAATHLATGSVAWVDGDGPLATLRGGFNVTRGCQSVIDVHPIIALHGASRVNLFDLVPAFEQKAFEAASRAKRHAVPRSGEYRSPTADRVRR